MHRRITIPALARMFDFDWEGDPFGLAGPLAGLIQAIFALVQQILQIITAAIYGAIDGITR